MPTYVFRHKDTGEEFSQFMSMSELDTYLKENPHIEQGVAGFSGIGDPIRTGRQKPDQNFRDLLREMNKKHKGAGINTFD